MFLKLVKFLPFILLFFSFNLCNYDEKIVDNKVDEYAEYNSLNKVVYEEKKKPLISSNISHISISKINLKKELYSVNSKLNNVNKNIEILKGSDMPDIENGNFILASHSGNSPISYFRNLYKLDIGDEIVIYYNNYKYVYTVDKKYEVVKTGKVSIKRDKSKRTITLITCKGADKQLVVIGYLV